MESGERWVRAPTRRWAEGAAPGRATRGKYPCRRQTDRSKTADRGQEFLPLGPAFPEAILAFRPDAQNTRSCRRRWSEPPILRVRTLRHFLDRGTTR